MQLEWLSVNTVLLQCERDPGAEAQFTLKTHQAAPGGGELARVEGFPITIRKYSIICSILLSWPLVAQSLLVISAATTVGFAKSHELMSLCYMFADFACRIFVFSCLKFGIACCIKSWTMFNLSVISFIIAILFWIAGIVTALFYSITTLRKQFSTSKSSYEENVAAAETLALVVTAVVGMIVCLVKNEALRNAWRIFVEKLRNFL
eukprot:TRINITY_DN916_c0_g1_i1.p1 TRINITY_DN916_c0_g1~~TRINITY_DN916_c0_g1_i1.p1  ORF type:complete len:206 (-),score=21.29 TRINITY_DN916_c0_g1_i1:45-662(-)